MKSHLKKGFTLVELLVVIAILAILATVSIVGYSSFTKKANLSNDNTVIAELNRFVDAYKATDNEIYTVTDAQEVLDESGFDLSKIKTSSKGYHYAYDIVADEFSLLDENFDLVEGYSVPSVGLGVNLDHEEINVYAFVTNETERVAAEAKGYSTYLQATFDGSTLTGNVTKGIDTGKVTDVSTINYVNTGYAQKVVFYTNTANTTINIEAPNDEIIHYGKVGAVIITEVKPSSYTEYGEVAWLELTKGRVVLKEESNVSTFYISKVTDTAFAENVIIVIEDDAKLPEFSRDEVTIDQENGTKVCTLETGSEKKDVYLFLNGIYEQIKVADASINNASKEWITSANVSTKTVTVAEDIANMFNNKKYNEYGGTSDAPTLNSDKTLSSDDEAKVNDDTFSSKETLKNSVIESAKNAELGGIVVSSSDDLKEELANIIADLQAHPEKCEDEITIILKPSEDQYRDVFDIYQYPEWNGIIGNGSTANNLIQDNKYKSAKKTKIVIKGSDGTIFGGTFRVWGFGYSNGGDPEFSNDVIYTKFEDIAFDQSYWNTYSNGVLKAGSTDSIWYPITATGASSNVSIENCTFVHTGRVQNGLSQAAGGYSYGFSMKNCTFTETDTVIQGYMHGQNTIMLDNITAIDTESFISITACWEAPVKLNNCSFKGVGHFIRIQTNTEVIATNCTINIDTPTKVENKEAIVLYRNDGKENAWAAGSVKLENCSIIGHKQISLWNDKNKNQAFTTTITLENCVDENNKKITNKSDLIVYDPYPDDGTKTITIK